MSIKSGHQEFVSAFRECFTDALINAKVNAAALEQKGEVADLIPTEKSQTVATQEIIVVVQPGVMVLRGPRVLFLEIDSNKQNGYHLLAQFTVAYGTSLSVLVDLIHSMLGDDELVRLIELPTCYVDHHRFAAHFVKPVRW